MRYLPHSRAALRTTALVILASIQLLTSGCATTPKEGEYNGLQHPGDTFAMFKDCMCKEPKYKRKAYALFSQRMRDEVISYTEFSLGSEDERVADELASLCSAEYVRAVFTNPTRTRARMTLRSRGKVQDFPMVLEDGKWRLDWSPAP